MSSPLGLDDSLHLRRRPGPAQRRVKLSLGEVSSSSTVFFPPLLCFISSLFSCHHSIDPARWCSLPVRRVVQLFLQGQESIHARQRGSAQRSSSTPLASCRRMTRSGQACWPAAGATPGDPSAACTSAPRTGGTGPNISRISWTLCCPPATMACCKGGELGQCCGSCAECTGDDDHSGRCVLLGGLSAAVNLELVAHAGMVYLLGTPIFTLLHNVILAFIIWVCMFRLFPIHTLPVTNKDKILQSAPSCFLFHYKQA